MGTVSEELEAEQGNGGSLPHAASHRQVKKQNESIVKPAHKHLMLFTKFTV